MKDEHKSIFLYIAKCATACLVLLSVGNILPQVDVSWILISVLLVLSPDGKEAIPLAIVRVKANLIASLSSMVLLLLCQNALIAICLGVTVTIIACYMFHLMAGSRAALAAVVIILLHPQGVHLWSTALERVFSVVLGCAFALLLSFVFHRDMKLRYTLSNDKHGE